MNLSFKGPHPPLEPLGHLLPFVSAFRLCLPPRAKISRWWCVLYIQRLPLPALDLFTY